ncbi:hypothetical protein [Nocardioides currus]|nr:hypothetical protein [Nocardioides currus]
MNGGTRMLAGIGAVVLVISGLGFATPSAADADSQAPAHSQVAVNR